MFMTSNAPPPNPRGAPTTPTTPTTPHRSSNSSNIFAPALSSPLSALPPSPPRTPRLLQPKRAFKPIPRSATSTAESRRTLFLKKVQSAREEAAWQARGGQDEIMRMIFVAEQKRWRASQEKAAGRIATIREEEEDDEGERGEELPEEEEELSEIVAQHDGDGHNDFEEFLDRDGRELEKLLSSMDLDLDQKMGDC